jgi:hypothetical protein
MALFMENLSAANREHSAAKASLDIVSPLRECVDKLSANTSANREDAPGSQAGETGNAASEHVSSGMPESSPDAATGDLSVYFKNARKHSVGALDMGEKLMQSTWEHIHTSIRLARRGDVKTSRMHIELADSALKEAERYLPAEIFSAFAAEVVSTLNEINDRTN